MKFLDELAKRRCFGMKPGLATMQKICRRLGDPQHKFEAIHVAGTNGKGAVCAILDACLGGGRYTSPHLVNLNERFFMQGQPVSDETLEAAGGTVSAAIADLEEVTFFEALSAVAFVLYARESDKHPGYPVVLETGLGGRLDATNVCEPRLCVITKIGLDHCDWLGDTVEKISAEKAGIIKPGVPVVLGKNDCAARKVVEARAREVGAPFFYAPDIVGLDEVPADFSLRGAFNRENAQTALAALQVLGARPSALPLVVWPGRFQRVGRFIIDGAHNPPAARALASSLAEEGFGDESLDLIAGFCGDKDVESVLRTLSPLVVKGYAVETNNPRSLTAVSTAEKMRRAGIDAVPVDSLDEALSCAHDSMSSATLVCGSLFLAGEALVALGAYPWSKEPRFDAAEILRASMSPLNRTNMV